MNTEKENWSAPIPKRVRRSWKGYKILSAKDRKARATKPFKRLPAGVYATRDEAIAAAKYSKSHGCRIARWLRNKSEIIEYRF